MYRETRQPWRWFDIGTHTLNKHLLYNLGAKDPILFFCFFFFFGHLPFTPVLPKPPLAHTSAQFLQGSFCVSAAALCLCWLRAHLAWKARILAPGTMSYCSWLYTKSGVPSYDSRQDPGPGVDSGPLYSPTHLHGTGAVGGGEMAGTEGPVKSISSVLVCQMG